MNNWIILSSSPLFVNIFEIMPELPEVETVVRELNTKLRGRTISRASVRAPKVVAVGPGVVSNIRKVETKVVKQFESFVKGQKVLSVKRRAKLLIFDFSGPLSMLVHLKMTGQFIFEDEKLQSKTHSKYRVLNKKTAPLVKLPGKHTHVVFYFHDNSVLYYNDVRKFGYLKVVRDEDWDSLKELKEYGPEPLSKEFTLQDFVEKAQKRKQLSVKQFLMDNKVVVGVGNIYSDEVLFLAKVDPRRKISKLNKKELERVFRAIVPVLQQGIKTKGSSVGDFIRTDGSWGTMGKFHFVYGRKGLPCKQCGTLITSVKLGGRTSSFCPKCQENSF